MADRCPLAGRSPIELGADAQGIVWDTGLPEQCRLHVARALGKAGAKTTFYRPELPPDQIEGLESGDTELATCEGIILPSADNPRALAVKDIMVDSLGFNEGPLLSRQVAPLPCGFDAGV